MKKILVLFVSVFTLGLTSCSSDDDSSSSSSSNIEGRWEYYEQGTITGEDEFLSSWYHGCSSKKDYFEILSDGELNDVYYSSACIADVTTGTWTKDGSTFSKTLNGENTLGEIMILNSTTLKIKYVDGVTTYVQVFKRQ